VKLPTEQKRCQEIGRSAKQEHPPETDGHGGHDRQKGGKDRNGAVDGPGPGDHFRRRPAEETESGRKRDPHEKAGERRQKAEKHAPERERPWLGEIDQPRQGYGAEQHEKCEDEQRGRPLQ